MGPKHSAQQQGLGRSRGGFSTKLVVTATDPETAIAIDVVPGQAHDLPQLPKMLRATLLRLPRLEDLAADKGFDGDAVRMHCLDHNVMPHIPCRKNRINLWAHDQGTYRGRNQVERLIGKAKQFRRVATRYEKLKQTFLGIVHLVFGFIRLRSCGIVNTA